MIRRAIRRMLGLPELPGIVTVSADPHTVDLYRFHPITGKDANDINTFRMSDEQKAEVAAMIRAGACFYWQRAKLADHLTDAPGVVQGYIRIEWNNFSFVAFATGLNVVRHESDHFKKTPA